MSVGAGVISDIYRLEERGSAMGFFFAVSLWLAHARKPEELTRLSLSLSLSPRALIGEPPRPLAFPGIGWDRGSLCVVARPATRFGHVQHGLIRHGVAVPTRNELAARTWNRQDTRGGRRRRCAAELVAKSIRAHLDIAEPERPRCCSSSPDVWKL
jgi:hypothetical protein